MQKAMLRLDRDKSMIDSEKQQELIRKSILAIYSTPTDRSTLINLSRQLNDWDDLNFPGKEFQAQKLFEDLQSLSAFLENRGLSAQADEVFRIILYIFPEKYFPSLPWLKESQEVDLRLLEEAQFVVKSKNYPDYTQESLRLFDEQFRKINRKLVAFAKEVEELQFKENGSGEAGEFFRRFADVAEKLHDTVLKDMPWTLINQLAMKMNNGLSCFQAAYLMLRALNTVKTARPSPGLIDLMLRNENFFLRNQCWKCIDDAMAEKDYSKLVESIDRFLPMADSGYERSNLLLMRDRALRNISEVPRNLVTYMLVFIVVVVIFTIIIYEPSPRSSLNLDRSREQLIATSKKSAATDPRNSETSDKVTDEELERALIVKSRTGLREKKPPVRPHNRKLTLPEIRHAVFQKIRLDYLLDQSLDKDEQKLLQSLIEDYNARCEFYEYNNQDREKAHWDEKINRPLIIQDAQDILAKWRSTNAPVDVSALVAKELLNLQNPEHVKILLERLRAFGYFKEKEIPMVWNDQARRALLDFKVSNMAIVDSNWDWQTQKALFGN